MVTHWPDLVGDFLILLELRLKTQDPDHGLFLIYTIEAILLEILEDF